MAAYYGLYVIEEEPTSDKNKIEATKAKMAGDIYSKSVRVGTKYDLTARSASDLYQQTEQMAKDAPNGLANYKAAITEAEKAISMGSRDSVGLMKKIFQKGYNFPGQNKRERDLKSAGFINEVQKALSKYANKSGEQVKTQILQDKNLLIDAGFGKQPERIAAFIEISAHLKGHDKNSSMHVQTWRGYFHDIMKGKAIPNELVAMYEANLQKVVFF